MKTHGSRKVVVAILLLVCGVGVGSAQNLLPATWNVPFSFTVGKAILPPGEYLIRGANAVNDWSFLLIQNQKGSESAYFTVSPSWNGEASENSKLVFHRYENQYFLAQICIEGEKTGRELPMTKAEREVARGLKHAQSSQAKIVTLVSEKKQDKHQSQF